MINTAEAPTTVQSITTETTPVPCQFHEMCRDCGIAHAILAVERHDDTRAINGI